MDVDSDGNANCPVSLDMLGRLYRADPSLVGEMIEMMPAADQAQLALFCYARSHLRDVALTIAASCQALSLSQIAGTMGEVLSAQSVAVVPARFGLDVIGTGHGKRPVTLARSAA